MPKSAFAQFTGVNGQNGTSATPTVPGASGAGGAAGDGSVTSGSGGNGGGPGFGTGSPGAGAEGGAGGVSAGADGGGEESGGGGGAGNSGGSGGGGGGGGGRGETVNSVGAFTNGVTVLGGNGGNGANGATTGSFVGGGGGGGGGIGMVFTGPSLLNTGSITGGNGGSGGIGIGSAYIPSLDDGKGGAGGEGLLSNSGTVTNAGTIQGGNGGFGNGTTSGAGGAGVVLNGSTLENSGTITGGSGGPAPTAGPINRNGTGVAPTAAGPGGVGILALTGTTIVNSGAISGGGAANAISFTAGVNRLELQAGYSITGNVVNTGTSATLGLGGATDSTFAASEIGPKYQGFTAFEKTGTSTWTLTGSTSAVTPWTISDGVLAIASDAALGAPSGQLTFDSGTLRFDASFNLAPTRAITIGPGGAVIDTQGFNTTISQNIIGNSFLAKEGSGTLTLTGMNSYIGGTLIREGRVAVAADSALGAPTGALLLDGGTLQLNASFNLAPTRTIFIGTQGTVDTNGFNSTISQGIAGVGSFTKIGDGTLTLSGPSTNLGGTDVVGGTLKAGAANVFGSPGGVATGPGGTLDLAGFDQTVTNALNFGVIQTGGTGNTSLTVTGAYQGFGGTLALNTFLGADASPSDKLVISGGTASGSTTLRVTNIGGPGAQTTGDGIPVVTTTGGGTTAAGAFTLGNIAAAGAYEYMLFQGGVSAGTANNWYLRSELISPTSPPPPTSPPQPPSPPPIPLFRPEASLYVQVPSLARQLQVFTLGTFHQRRGDQSLDAESDQVLSYAPGPALSASSTGAKFATAAWARAYGQTFSQRWDGALSPEFSGQMIAFQAGRDVVEYENAFGHTGRAGLFFAHSEVGGDARGFALGQQRLPVGTLPITSENIGAYWTHVGPHQWYVDAVMMGSFFSANPTSYRQIGMHVRGDGMTASLEAGVPLRLARSFTLEPQGQIIWQRTRFDNVSDPFSQLRYDLDDSFVGRVGLRLETATRIYGVQVQPFALANLWHTFDGTDQTIFNNVTAFPGTLAATSLEAGGGAIAQVTERFNIYLRGNYTTNLGGKFREAAGGQLGVRLTW